MMAAKTTVTIGLATICACAGALHAGRLAPPPGPVTPTMKPLDQIEPRVCINDLPGDPSAVHVISAPGNYYLCADVLGQPGKHGIVIDVAGLPPGEPYYMGIDGGGFSIRGVPGALDGLHKSGGAIGETLTVKMGRVELAAWPGDGIHLDNLSGLQLNEVTTSGNGGGGVVAITPPSAGTYVYQLTGCGSSGNGANGIDLISSVPGSLFELVHCLTMQNSADGVHLIDADCTVIDCTSNDNGGNGFFASNAGECKYWCSRSMAMNNTGDGIQCVDIRAGFETFAAVGNGGDGVKLRNSTPTEAQFSSLIDSYCVGNGGSGVRLTDVAATMVRGTLSGNTGDGVTATASGGGPSKVLSWSWTDCTRNGQKGMRASGMDLTLWRSKCTNNLDGGALVESGVIHSFAWDCTGNTGNGLQAVDCSVRLEGGSFSDNSLVGVLAEDLRDGSLDGVDASRNGGSGVLADSSGGLACGELSLRSCVLNGNTFNGVALFCTTGGVIRRCEAIENGGPGVLVSGTGHVVIENVAYSTMAPGFSVPVPGNTTAVIVDEFGATVNTNPGANYTR